MVLSVPTAGVCVWLTGDIVGSLRVGLWCAAGIFISPDLDVDGMTFSEWSIARLWFPLNMLAGPFVAFWMPYALLIPHRSAVSHVPILSTVIRVVYMLLPLVALWYFGVVAVNWEIVLMLLGLEPMLGLSVSDFGHWILDGAPM